MKICKRNTLTNPEFRKILLFSTMKIENLKKSNANNFSRTRLFAYQNCFCSQKNKYYKYLKYFYWLSISHFICSICFHIWAHCVKSILIRSFFWSVFSCIQSEYRKIRTRKTPHLDIFSCSGWIREYNDQI